MSTQRLKYPHSLKEIAKLDLFLYKRFGQPFDSNSLMAFYYYNLLQVVLCEV